MKAVPLPLIISLQLFTALVVLSNGSVLAQTNTNGQPFFNRSRQDIELRRLNELREHLANNPSRPDKLDRRPREHKVPNPALLIGLVAVGGVLLHRKITQG